MATSTAQPFDTQAYAANTAILAPKAHPAFIVTMHQTLLTPAVRADDRLPVIVLRIVKYPLTIFALSLNLNVLKIHHGHGRVSALHAQSFFVPVCLLLALVRLYSRLHSTKIDEEPTILTTAPHYPRQQHRLRSYFTPCFPAAYFCVLGYKAKYELSKRL